MESLCTIPNWSTPSHIYPTVQGYWYHGCHLLRTVPCSSILIWWEWSDACSIEGIPENEIPTWAIKSDPRCTSWCNYRLVCHVMGCTLACKWHSWGLSNQLHGFGLVCWSLTSLCHSNGHIATMPTQEINPFTALTRIRSQFLRTQWSTSNHQRVDTTTPQTAEPSGLANQLHGDHQTPPGALWQVHQ